MTTPPKDRPILARFKTWAWWTLVEWDGSRWKVVNHSGGRYFEEADLFDWQDVGERNRTGIARPKEQEQVSFKSLNKIVID